MTGDRNAGSRSDLVDWAGLAQSWHPTSPVTGRLLNGFFEDGDTTAEHWGQPWCGNGAGW